MKNKFLDPARRKAMNGEKFTTLKVRKVRPDAKIPIRASDGAIGYDVYASIVFHSYDKKQTAELPIVINPGEKALIGIGVAMAIPWPFQAEVRPRSGIATKFKVQLLNSPGTIDPDFRGEAGCLLHNVGDTPFTVEKDMRIAQLIFTRVEIPEIVEVDELLDTKRSAGGFGHTGLIGEGLGTEQYDNEIEAIDRTYLEIAQAIGKRTPAQQGCVIVQDDTIISQGYCLVNQEDEVLISAEMDAVFRSAKLGHSTKNATMYLATKLVMDVDSIIKAGITTVVVFSFVNTGEWCDQLQSNNVQVRFVKNLKST